jgi:hypothetical protein
MADISISINPAETISANISPPNSISIGPSTSYPPHGLSHAPGAYDSLSAYYVTTGSTGNFVTGNVVRPSDTGAFLTTGAADGRYALQSATGSFITTSQTGQFVSTGSTGIFVTGSVVRPSETGVFITASQTGAFLTTGAADNRYALQSATGNFVTTAQTGQFYPTSNPSGFLTSGSSLDLIHLYAKNDQGSTIYKGQPVYIGGANGANPLIKLASNTGETTSSKTIGLLAQDLSVNQFGYIITEGILEGFNTSAATAGDPMWLGTTGNIIYGLANKPYGNNHLVYLGVVLRSQSNNGKVYIKPQNGFEIEELHRVYAKNANSKDTLMYDSTSGSWFARQISTGDVSGISSYATNSSVVSLTGNQDVSGIKNFFSRPTVAGTGVLLSGESITTQPNDANLIIGLSLFL